MVNVAVMAPGATVTNGGTVADVLSLAMITTLPLAGAADDKVTVPVELEPPKTRAGFSAMPLIGVVLTRVPTTYRLESAPPM